MNLAILGAGGGGLSAAIELSINGHTTRLWNRSAAALEPFEASGEIHYTGVLGTGSVRPELVSTDLAEVVAAADAMLICLPTLAHRAVAEQLLEHSRNEVPVILNPGHTGGAMEFCHVFRRNFIWLSDL